MTVDYVKGCLRETIQDPQDTRFFSKTSKALNCSVSTSTEYFSIRQPNGLATKYFNLVSGIKMFFLFLSVICFQMSLGLKESKSMKLLPFGHLFFTLYGQGSEEMLDWNEHVMSLENNGIWAELYTCF